MIKYISLEEILRLHFQVVEDYGGSHGVRDEGRINSVVNAPKQIAFGVEQYPDLIIKASVYLRNIVADHPFVDGNKRTAITVCWIFLQRNGYQINVTPKKLEDFVISIAVEHYDIETISSWLRVNTSNK